MDTKILKRSFLASAAAFVFGDGGFAFAQEAATAPSQVVAQEIIVTAQKRAERLENVPITINVVGAAQLEQAGVTNLKDLGNAVPGVKIGQAGVFAVPTVRGITDSKVTPSSEPSNAIFLDGNYIPSRSGMLFDLPDVERIDVMKGPQSTLAGPATLGGAIMIQTAAPSDVMTGMVRLSGGLYDGGGQTGAASGYVSGPLASQLNGSLSVGYNRNTGYVRNILKNNELTAGGWSGFVRGKLGWTPSDKVDVLASVWYGKGNNPLGVTYTPNPVCRTNPAAAVAACLATPTRPRQVATDASSFHTTENLGATVRAAFDLGEGTLTSTSGYTWMKNHGLVEGDGTTAVLPVTEAINDARSISQNLDFASKERERFSYIMGFSYLHVRESWNPLTVQFLGQPALFRVYSTFPMTSYGAYGELHYNVTDRITIIGGIRYINQTKEQFAADMTLRNPGDDLLINGKTFNHWTPRGSIRYKLTDTSNVYYTYSTGFQAPPFGSTNTEPLVNPETIRSHEVGYKIAEGTFSLNASAFYYQFKDFIAQSAFQNAMGSWVDNTQNAAGAEAYGLDIDGNAQITPDFQVSAGLSYQPRANFTDFPVAVVNLNNPSGTGTLSNQRVDLSGGRLRDAPKLTLNVSPQYTARLAAGDLVLGASVYYSSKFFYDYARQIEQGSYVIANANISFTPKDTDTRITFWVKNLGNETYTNGYWTSGFFGVTYGPPREIGISLEKRW